MKRSSGILLPISALPSRGGIGSFGAAADDFADFLEAAGQSLWQILPMGPAGYGDSPYSAFSTFAGNPYYIDLELLVRDGLLLPSELPREPRDLSRVDYGQLYLSRGGLLRMAYQRAGASAKAEVEAFSAANPWLEDYALFMALKTHFGMASWQEWEDEGARMHLPDALARWSELLADDVGYHKYLQCLFFSQWQALRGRLHRRGISVIGDLPVYVAADSADVWSSPQFFCLDAQRRALAVAGVPPDYFSADGQLWGNPLYDWERMRADGYGWWIRRMDGAQKLCDIVRIDHFRGLDRYWSVPAGAGTAERGEWLKGPGMGLISVLKGWFGALPVIAEDLGELDAGARKLLADSGYPGMRVLEFAFSGGADNAYLPHNHIENSVCYIGTHDNAPVMQWLAEAPGRETLAAREYFGISPQEEFNWGMLRGGMSSVAGVFIAQMQDVLGLGAESRMNTPGTAQGNWSWRLLPGQASPELAARLRELTGRYGRAPQTGAAE